MAFWGIEVKPGKPITHSCEKARGRLRISQATLGISQATKKTIVQCNVGNRTPVLLCALLPNKTESCHLDLEFEEADDVVFSVIGPRSVYLTGYYVLKIRQSDPHSDTESYGVDIENTQTEGSTYCSDDDKYEDSFINDNELKVSPEFPSEGMDDDTLENDKPKDRTGHGKQHKKKYRVIESDNDANSHESEDKDEGGYSLSLFKSERAMKILSDAAEMIANVTVEMGNEAKDDGACGSEPKQKIDSSDINDKLERAAKLPSDEEGTVAKNEIPKEVQTFEEAIVSKEEVLTGDLTHGNNEMDAVKNQKLPMSNGNDHIQSLDLAKKKRKRRTMKGTNNCEVQTDNEDQSVLREVKEHEVEASTDLREIGANDLMAPPKLGSVNGQQSKKRKKVLQFEGTTTQGIDEKCDGISKDDKHEHESPHDDSIIKDLPAANGEYLEQQIDNNISIRQSEKKIKKRKKKTQGKRDLDMGVIKLVDNQDTMPMEHEDQTTNTVPIQMRTFSNGLTIEELVSGPPDGKVAAPSKMVKIYYTAMLKESGLVVDSNVDKSAFKFRLGDEEFIDGWNVGIDGMRVGDKRRLIIPPAMGFGDQGVGDNIPPNSWLVYDIELVGVRN